MKRAYQKPTLEVESFAITQQITSCAGIKIGFTDYNCVLNDPDATWQMKTYAKEEGWFIDTNCRTNAIGMNDDNGICYHTNANPAFTS